MVTAPAVCGAVNVAVYVPLPLSVTEPIDPTGAPERVAVRVTVAPPVETALPPASRACTVTVVVGEGLAAVRVAAAVVIAAWAGAIVLDPDSVTVPEEAVA